jgi:hypothetical protein
MDFLRAAETGDLEGVKKYLSKEAMQDLVADVNATGID